MSTPIPQNPPPGYSDSDLPSDPLLISEDGPAASQQHSSQPGAPRSQYDHLPDDFKYDLYISDCELDIRMAFIRKVYTILSLQLLATTAIASLFILKPGLTEWALQNQWAFWTSFAGSIVLMFCAFWKSRSYPINLVFLGGFTLFESYILGFTTSLFDTKIVIMAFLLTLIIFAGLTAFAFQTKYDFTQWQGILCGILFLFVGIGFISLFFPFNSVMELIYSVLGAILFSVYIIVDTQLILSKYHPEEEIPAAISLYLDVINLFIYILRILNEVQDN